MLRFGLHPQGFGAFVRCIVGAWGVRPLSFMNIDLLKFGEVCK